MCRLPARSIICPPIPSTLEQGEREKREGAREGKYATRAKRNLLANRQIGACY